MTKHRSSLDSPRERDPRDFLAHSHAKNANKCRLKLEKRHYDFSQEGPKRAAKIFNPYQTPGVGAQV